MKVTNISVKSVISKSKISNFSYAINAYNGCPHGCLYCYAKFMSKLTNHTEKWGEYIDIKHFLDSELDRFLLSYRGEKIFLSSVTDCYNPFEAKVKNTRKVLEKFANSDVCLQILTKSKLVLRDLDLFKTMPNLCVGVSLSCLDETLAKKLEPNASSPKQRLEALEVLKQNGIKTLLFISPIFPAITPVFKIIDEYSQIADEIGFEGLNLYPESKDLILSFIGRNFADLLGLYKDIYIFKRSDYFQNLSDQIDEKMQGKNYFKSFKNIY